MTNFGSAYNAHVGIFSAPYSGVYVLMATIFIITWTQRSVSFGSQWEHCKIYVGGVGSRNYDTSAGSFVLYLTKGDVVAVQKRNLAEGVYGQYYSYFSGFLLSIVE
ncbi:hypothetical protein DPMN_063876 [Dreissena polymorpha]|uniref:C1q domain-containing protein n=1 Tax=Dreissena polymorpha TaxID=45954 RepID=A0A9D4HKK8_DREPO|nr:hypothetical protein DPMN_063876 [Dreissena polymorpha]